MKILIIILFEIALCSSPYLSLEKTELYSIIEYELLSKNNDRGIFILNQPYNINQIDDLLSNSTKFKRILNRDNYWRDLSNEKINLRFSPSLNNCQTEDDYTNYFGLNLDGVIKISDVLLVNELELDEKFKYDVDFHGDSSEWLMGYFNSSYAQYKKNGLELFAGRLSRNFGALNDYGLILSNNPYAFDHYGFSAIGNKMRYSFYTTRLNDMLGIDLQGKTIPIDSIASSRRFWAIQRLDYRINNRFQVALSEAIIYGGPNQQFVSSYLNPTNFFYTSQRNQNIQMNGFWQINIFYKPASSIGLYIDLFVDDIIVNNDLGINDREKHPDRLGVLVKASYAKKNKTLVSLRYVRIWNETYTSFRTFENYTYFNNGIGYPYNSYESIKCNYTLLHYLPTFIDISLELWRNGSRDLISPFHDELNVFPVGPVTQGSTFNMHATTLQGKVKYEAHVNMIYRPENWSDSLGIGEPNFKELVFEMSLKFSYSFNYNKL